MSNRKTIAVTINGTRRTATVTRGDNIAILGLFFYTAEERAAIKNRSLRAAEVKIDERWAEILKRERVALKAELEQAGKTLSDEEMSKELNTRLHQRIGEDAISRIEFDTDTRYDAAARITEIFKGKASGQGLEEVWYDAVTHEAGLRLDPDEVTEIALEIFRAFPPEDQLKDAIAAKGLDTPIETPPLPTVDTTPQPAEPEPEPQTETVAVEATTVETYEPGSLGYRLKAMGTLSDEQIAAMVIAAGG